MSRCESRVGVREDIGRKVSFFFGHWSNGGRGGWGHLTMPEFVALFQEVQFWCQKDGERKRSFSLDVFP